MAYAVRMETTSSPKEAATMKHLITISHAFEGIINPILGDAAGYDGTEDTYLIRLAAVANAEPVKTTKAGVTIELDEDGLAVLREEAVYRVEWALDEAAAEWGGQQMAWFATARSAKAMIARIDKITA